MSDFDRELRIDRIENGWTVYQGGKTTFYESGVALLDRVREYEAQTRKSVLDSIKEKVRSKVNQKKKTEG